jgi:predicted transcriptional regulator
MTATEVQHLRHRLGLSIADFAALVGTGDKTIYRWEHAADGVDITAKCDILQRRLLPLLRMVVERDRDAPRNATEKSIIEGVVLGGGLRGLHRLLQAVFEK